MGENAPSAFVSWAHRAQDWTSEQAKAWEDTVRQFTDALRLAGVDADVDLYHYSDVDVDWTRYGTSMIEKTDTTIIAMSTAWAQRWQGTNSPTVGAGAAREADALHGRFDKDQEKFQRSVKIVILPGADKADVPEDLRRLTSYEILNFSPESLDEVLRTLHRSPRYVRPQLGTRPELPPIEPNVLSAETITVPVDDSWRPVAHPVISVPTPLDGIQSRLMSAALELQLLRDPVESPRTATALRKIASELEVRLQGERPALGLGQQNVLLWNVTAHADTDQATAAVESRFPAFEVSPDFLVYLYVCRDGSVVAAMQLRRNALGAKITEKSLVAVTIRLLQTAYDLAVGSTDVVPILRLGPMDGVSPGDPASLQGSGSAQASFPWMSRGTVSTHGTDALPKHYLISAAQEVASELVTQLVSELDRPRSA